MGLYNIVFGENQYGQALVYLLQTRQEFNVGRYRDAWVERDGDDLLIRVHTRNGGGNREDYDDGSMTNHPWYVKDADEDYDCTYADWWFRPDLKWIANQEELGPNVVHNLAILAGDPVDMSERWTAAIEALGQKNPE